MKTVTIRNSSVNRALKIQGFCLVFLFVCFTFFRLHRAVVPLMTSEYYLAPLDIHNTKKIRNKALSSSYKVNISLPIQKT